MATPTVTTRTLALVEAQSAAWPEAGIVIEFKGYTDGRCRRELKPCDKEGASVEALVRIGDAAPREIRLRIDQPEQHAPFQRVGAFQFQLLNLQPVGRPLPKDDPSIRRQARVLVTRAERASVTVGQSVTLPESNLTIDFVAFEDHRCPLGVACATAGWATATLSVRSPAGGSPKTLLLWGPGKLPYAVAFGHEIELCAAEPRPDATTGKPATPVRAELFVVPSSDPAPKHGFNPMCQ
ncbi:MAG: hypothetical protein EPO06_10955 [Burkholderiaceae bacterium]|nr:MAG: hypothetical protein EPO06_10955 [Burkholderiaceae bacterium]